ncbi:ATP-dependent DNA helicase RecG [Denitrobaculum tricleocarpae]|uniref:ATP-dependent DNA helicase RecG n=1 Tax=Denitrobaculum tricleocarpae TaxID=2591009 RepID=A0A545TPU4_9PROT|nr:ATP-dependent DNA helicase RecG [Denitrobaculum tricleocarpae]TQV79245.1 ATP-dependent DNA helicase RecG [Denitrobaculum tricleocarpae]
MRPEILFPLFAPITSISGIGPRFAALFERLVGAHVLDLCWHLPNGLIDRRYSPRIAEAQPGRIATISARVLRHHPAPARGRPYRVVVGDDSGELQLVFFHARADYLEKILPEGEIRVVSGKLEVFGGGLQMSHPDHIVPESERADIQTVQPVYPLTAGLPQKVVAKAVTKAVETALAHTADFPEWLDPALQRQRGWPGWYEALRDVHRPQEAQDLEATTPVRSRLAYDELLANQLALALIRRNQTRHKGRRITGDSSLRARVLDALPFALTNSQHLVLSEIDGDMASDSRMLRLVQGDVGSGKTVVALLAMMAAVESGAQAAIMAPTEILARQHHKTIEPLARAAGVAVELLTGRDKGKGRAAVLARIASGESAIVIGTHALFQQDVAFNDLALAVIDEQHRFGVHQRLTLAEKGRGVDMLVMTATPIPRTLMLTAYGDMDVSKITEKPAGRQPIDTRTLPTDRLPEVVDGIGRALRSGTRVYWVCPLVEESELSDLAAAEDRYRELQMHFGERVGLVHGKMKAKEKDAAMAAFVAGDTSLLVATTVIEVGVDVPEASIMVIEHAERFGLAQLHQLRGRIGRGSQKSSCLLLYQGPLGEISRARLNIMRETDDGFRIAEEDLRLRGAGELLGTRQSGFPEFRLADLQVHGDLLAVARDDAQLILNKDPDLDSERGQALRVLLYLFERDAAVKYLRSG